MSFCKEKSLAAVFRGRNILLITTLITTWSTMGLIGLCVMVLHQVFVGRSQNLSQVLQRYVAAVCGFAIVVIIVSSPRVYDRVLDEINKSQAEAGIWQITRIGNAIYDASFIVERPALGWSMAQTTRVVTDPLLESFIQGQGNGLTGFAVRFGVLGLFLYLFLVYRSGIALFGGRFTALCFVGVVSISLFGEHFLNYPLFWMLAFVRQKNNESSRSHLGKSDLQTNHICDVSHLGLGGRHG